MSEERKPDDIKAVQTDRESQEYGAQHGQDVTGNETGSSSPTTGGARPGPGGDARETGGVPED